jgi:hypothetical protein
VRLLRLQPADGDDAVAPDPDVRRSRVAAGAVVDGAVLDEDVDRR